MKMKKFLLFMIIEVRKFIKNEGLRLDYIFISKSLLKEVVDLEILTSIRKKRKPTPSDHVPVILELR